MSDTHSMPEYTQKLIKVWDRMKTGQAGFYELTDIVEEAISKEKQDLLEIVIARLHNERDIHIDNNTSFSESIDQVIYELTEKLAEMKGEK